jgi:hypothetical protein
MPGIAAASDSIRLRIASPVGAASLIGRRSMIRIFFRAVYPLHLGRTCEFLPVRLDHGG